MGLRGRLHSTDYNNGVWSKKGKLPHERGKQKKKKETRREKKIIRKIKKWTSRRQMEQIIGCA